MKKKLFYLIFCLSIICCGWTKDGESPWLRISDSPVTPHRTFANPVEGKKLKIMIFACGLGQRELVELKQRFEYDYYLWPIQSQERFSPFTLGYNEKKSKNRPVYAAVMTPDDYQTEVKRLLSQLNDSDLVISGKLPLNKFPAEIRTRILDRVKNGLSLILISKDGTDQTLAKVVFNEEKIDFPIHAIPTLAGTKIKTGTLGKGKIMVISYPGIRYKIGSSAFVGSLSPYESDDPLYYDYIMAFIGKCIWRLADPERAIIGKVSSDGTVILKKKVPAGSKIAFTVVDAFGNILLKGDKAAEQKTVVALPELPATARMLDIKLVSGNGKTIDYAVAPLTGKKDVTISGIVLPKDGWKIDEKVTGTIELSDRAKGVLKLSFTDNFGREIYRKEISFSGKTVDFTAAILHQKSSYAVLSVRLIQNGILIDEARKEIFFDTSRDVSDFIFGMWSYGGANARVANLWLKELARHGVDAVMDAGIIFASEERSRFIPRNLKKAGLNFAAYTTRLVGEYAIQQTGKCGYGFWEKYQQTGSLTDEQGHPWDREVRETRIANGAKNIGVLFYNLGDENASAHNVDVENCFCNDCQRRFREYLKRKHGSIANLNNNYGSRYKSFDEIKAQPFVKGVKSGKYCEWVDFRMFMEEQFINWHLYQKAKIRSIDREARVGLEGMVQPASSFTGFNFYKMMPHFEFCCPYFIQRDVRAVCQYSQGENGIAPVRGAWFGSYEGEMNEQYIRQQPWRYLFAGLGGAFYWTSGFPPTGSTFSNACVSGPDLRMLSHFTNAAEQADIIKKSGIGKMLLNSKSRYDGVLVHYSNPSLHVSTLNPEKSTWESSHSDIQGILDSLGIGFRYISPEKMEEGIPTGTKVVILPYSQAMSKKETEALRAFVKNGGMVMADHSPAVANQHGRFLSDSMLLDVFGKFEKMNIHRYGKGCAVYLDDYLGGASARVLKNEATGLQKGMLHLLKTAGVRPFASVTDGQGKIQSVSIFEHDSAKYLCLLGQRTRGGEQRKSAAGAEAAATKTSVGGSLFRTVILKKPMHVYDILDGNRYLGNVKKFSVELKPAVGRVFACLEKPAQKPQIKVKGSIDSVTPGKAIVFDISGYDNTGILQIKDPAGKIRDVQRVTGKTARFIPAYNEPAGTWSAELKNAVGGLTSTASFTLKY